MGGGIRGPSFFSIYTVLLNKRSNDLLSWLWSECHDQSLFVLLDLFYGMVSLIANSLWLQPRKELGSVYFLVLKLYG
jgi:hypothetical protein